MPSIIWPALKLVQFPGTSAWTSPSGTKKQFGWAADLPPSRNDFEVTQLVTVTINRTSKPAILEFNDSLVEIINHRPGWERPGILQRIEHTATYWSLQPTGERWHSTRETIGNLAQDHADIYLNLGCNHALVLATGLAEELALVKRASRSTMVWRSERQHAAESH